MWIEIKGTKINTSAIFSKTDMKVVSQESFIAIKIYISCIDYGLNLADIAMF